MISKIKYKIKKTYIQKTKNYWRTSTFSTTSPEALISKKLTNKTKIKKNYSYIFTKIYRRTSTFSTTSLEALISKKLLIVALRGDLNSLLQNALQRTAAHGRFLQRALQSALQRTATHCNTLQHCIATHCNTLQHTATHCSKHCNPLQHTATPCNNTLQHIRKLLTTARRVNCNQIGLRLKSRFRDPISCNTLQHIENCWPRHNLSRVARLVRSYGHGSEAL